MSQYQLVNGRGETVVYGFDAVSGYFIQVHDSKGHVVLHRWSALDGLTGTQLVDLAEVHGASLPEQHMLCAMLDLPFDEYHPLVVGG